MVLLVIYYFSMCKTLLTTLEIMIRKFFCCVYLVLCILDEMLKRSKNMVILEEYWILLM